MRATLSATLIWLAAGPLAATQAPAASAARPKQAATAPARPALQTPADTADAMAQAERLAIQSDLAWVGQYNGAITGDISERMVAAIKEFQKDRGGKPTGVLNLGGGAAATSVKASVAQAGGGNDLALSPAPVLGFPAPPRLMATANSPASRC